MKRQKPYTTLAEWNKPASSGDWARGLVTRRVIAFGRWWLVVLIAAALGSAIRLFFPTFGQ